MSLSQRGKQNELKLNESYMDKKTRLGSVIAFGETIQVGGIYSNCSFPTQSSDSERDCLQLLHVRSGKFLTIFPEQLARDERENIRLGLSSEGNTMSWLTSAQTEN